MSYVVFSIIFFDFEESGERKVMKIGVKMDKRGKERLREQKNEYNRFKEMPARAPETSIEGRRERQQSSGPHRPDGKASNIGGPGPALSILLRKIQRTQNRRE